ncbi:MAG: methylated-DNA--[protein]-cysteine S-methyltransferase [Chloroflexi bacterium]|nr:methylated-DNA--[protein]-cysteine S-methyltransferase [Chloroflexota bacterium]
MKAYLDEIGSPVGPMVLATNDEGALAGLWFRDGRHPMSLENRLKREGFDLVRGENRTAAVREQLVAYFAGKRRSFDLPLARTGSDFQRAVWEEISRIPFGETRTYGELARAVGHSGEAVEVGSACAANPILLVVPCHRVVGADGSLKGYAAGVRLKERLLAFEACRTPATVQRRSRTSSEPDPIEPSRPQGEATW